MFADEIHFRIPAYKISDFSVNSFLFDFCNIKLFNNCLRLFIFIIGVAADVVFVLVIVIVVGVDVDVDVFACCTLHAVRCAHSPTGSPFIQRICPRRSPLPSSLIGYCSLVRATSGLPTGEPHEGMVDSAEKRVFLRAFPCTFLFVYFTF